jgi:hypothetical protein
VCEEFSKGTCTEVISLTTFWPSSGRLAVGRDPGRVSCSGDDVIKGTCTENINFTKQ